MLKRIPFDPDAHLLHGAGLAGWRRARAEVLRTHGPSAAPDAWVVIGVGPQPVRLLVD
ncbi:hypothetical protein [Yinghuangia soli]|uniref:Uncharacterized protein n=1 Tax=Yinghuangia soli TaxID=2908204 RepID=A0AA41U3E0_9ACTN|nr:hypothetical protein [Yinghuangia soli]MCF2532663.1 hypothetical protein [Yinghuangia soli]